MFFFFLFFSLFSSRQAQVNTLAGVDWLQKPPQKNGPVIFCFCFFFPIPLRSGGEKNMLFDSSLGSRIWVWRMPLTCPRTNGTSFFFLSFSSPPQSAAGCIMGEDSEGSCVLCNSGLDDNRSPGLGGLGEGGWRLAGLSKCLIALVPECGIFR